MEGVATLISGLAVVFAWRILLSIAVSAPLAFLIGTFFGPIVGFAAAVLGLAFGLMWHARAPDGAAPFKYVPSPRICWLVKFVGLAFIGALVGGFAAEVADSLFGGAALLVAATAFVGAVHARATRRSLNYVNLLLEMVSLLFGLGVIYCLSLLRP
jgi:hypothetical protein